MTPEQREVPGGVRILFGLFVGKGIWDVITIWDSWPDFSYPKLGIVSVLPVILFGLARGRNWAILLAGVVAMFWIAFVIARLVGPVFSMEPIAVAFPWSNLIGFPAVVMAMNNLQPDAAKG